MRVTKLVSTVLRRTGLIALGVLLFFLHIPWHEIVGHGFVGVLCGGRVTRLQMFGVQVYPELKWTGTQEGMGFCDVTDYPHKSGVHFSDLAGSVSTFVVSVIAAVVMMKRSWNGWRFTVLISLWLWWLDLFTFTLPSFGVRRGIVVGTHYSEPYEAALALGVPGPLFQGIVIGACAFLLWLRVVQAIRNRRAIRYKMMIN